MTTTFWVVVVGMLLVIIPLAFLAGKLMYQLKEQTERQNKVRNDRIETISESIQTIAMAVEQQQCNLSEGAIRLVRLLEALPVKDVPDCKVQYPAMYELFLLVRELPTHEERKALSVEIRDQQDKEREEHESRLETKILQEVATLKSFNI